MMKPTEIKISVAKLWVNRLAFMFFSLLGYFFKSSEKEVISKKPKKRRRQQLVQHYQFHTRFLSSENGAAKVLGFNFMITIYFLLKFLNFEIDFNALCFGSFGASFYITYWYLDRKDFFRMEFTPLQMKRDYEERLNCNVKTFLVFFSLPILWFVWILNQ